MFTSAYDPEVIRHDAEETDVSLEDIKSPTRALANVATQLYGEAWVQRLAAHRKISLRTVQRWASGAFAVPDSLITELEDEAERVEHAGHRKKIADAVQAALDDGMDRALVHAILRDLADRTLPPGAVKNADFD